ncbi:hypothetical protein [Myroides fluvii]|uniref:hypothetical protein n=1 Tax=Myroides fluvii TaxID=2572594 RepID=UPI00131DFE74|nr:hypothetical protein [Myroides fluvii]
MAELKLEDVGFSSCEPTGALGKKIFYAPLSYFESVGVPKDLCGDQANAAETFAELAEIKEIKLKQGYGFTELTMITETGEITSTQIGEKGRRLFENSLVAQIAGSKSSLLGFCRWVKNQDLIIVTQEFDSGQMRLLGSERMPAWVDAQEHKIEAAAEGNNSLNITFKDKSKWPAAVFTGDLVLFPEPNSPGGE